MAILYSCQALKRRRRRASPVWKAHVASEGTESQRDLANLLVINIWQVSRSPKLSLPFAGPLTRWYISGVNISQPSCRYCESEIGKAHAGGCSVKKSHFSGLSHQRQRSPNDMAAASCAIYCLCPRDFVPGLISPPRYKDVYQLLFSSTSIDPVVFRALLSMPHINFAQKAMKKESSGSIQEYRLPETIIQTMDFLR